MEVNDIRVDLARDRNLLAIERTRLSAERTVSAWMRTGLASVGGGFAIIRLLAFETVTHRIMAHAVGEILIIGGMFILIFALRDYRKGIANIKATVRKTNQLFITITTCIFVLVSLFLFFVTIT